MLREGRVHPARLLDGLQLLMRVSGMLAGDGSVTIDARRQILAPPFCRMKTR
jgi:hypothetical protein